jgi:glyoxylase-like metal-dependent hydrolase (beta-lactamase superfamily II)
MRFGNLDLFPVSDGIYWSDGSGLFGTVPKVEWAEMVAPDELNRLPHHLHCLLIDTGAQRILVDTGHGDRLSEKEKKFMSLEGERRLLRSLEALGVGPSDVDMVINTHLHNDHSGGNTYFNENGEAVPTFPWAVYYIQRLELAEATFPNERTRSVYLRDDWEPLQRSDQLRVLSGDTRLTDEVRVLLTPGHTPGHQIVVVTSAGHMAAFMGDVASWPIHLERLDCIPAYDIQPLINVETKRHLAQWAIENQVLLFFEHHPQIVAGYLHPTDRPDRFRLEPVEYLLSNEGKLGN